MCRRNWHFPRAGRRGGTPSCGQNGGMSSPSDAQDTAEYIPFEEFRNGLPHGRFRVVVNPKLAAPFVAYRTHATPLALVGHVAPGGLLVAAGIGLRWSLKAHAPRILLHLASRVPSVYAQATEHGVMEVRRAV